MSKHQLSPKLEAIANTDKIDSYDVYVLRREFLGDNKICQAEAEQLFILDMAVSEKCHEWGHFFSEVLVDYTVHQCEPTQVVSQKNAQWLVDQIAVDGLVSSPEQMEMLVKVLETAQYAPNFLAKFALEQVSHAVLNNQGPVAVSRTGDKCVICKDDVEIIRRLMYGFSSEGGLAITKEEAEFLFDLNDQTIENKNDPAWCELFMRAVGNYLLATMNNAVPERRVILEDSWNVPGDTKIGTLANMLRSVFQEVKSNSSRLEADYSRNNASIITSADKAAIVTSEEAEWAANRIGADGVIHKNEKALLRFLKEESPQMHPDLQKLVDQAA